MRATTWSVPAYMNDANRSHDEAHEPGEPHFLAHHFGSYRQQFDAGKLGMWIFLLTEILLFGGLFCAYAIFRANHPGNFHLRRPLPRQEPRRAEHLRAHLQQPDDGLGSPLRRPTAAAA